MKKFWVPMIIGIVFMMAPVMAIGASLTGSIQGFNCVTQGKVCPIGMEDPVIAAENVFVLLVDAAKGDYYFVPNVDRAILATAHQRTGQNRWDGEREDEIHQGNRSLCQGRQSGWKKVWDVNLEDKIYEDIFGGSLQSGKLIFLLYSMDIKTPGLHRGFFCTVHSAESRGHLRRCRILQPLF